MPSVECCLPVILIPFVVSSLVAIVRRMRFLQTLILQPDLMIRHSRFETRALLFDARSNDGRSRRQLPRPSIRGSGAEPQLQVRHFSAWRTASRWRPFHQAFTGALEGSTSPPTSTARSHIEVDRLVASLLRCSPRNSRRRGHPTSSSSS